MSIDKLTKEEIIKRAREDKKSLIAEKTAKVKFTDSLSYRVEKPSKEETGKADVPDSSSVKKDTLDVKIVCNTAWFCDSQMDVLTSDSYDKSVASKGNSIPHIADHKQSSTAHVGDVKKVYTQDIQLTDLGYQMEGSTTALVMESTVRKDYNEDVFKFYANGKINQHSIGLRYVDIQLAINSDAEEDKAEFAVWTENYPKIINKELVDKKGYFWLVKEIDVIENSCVLFGANSLTPTLEVKSSNQPTKPISTTTGQTTMNLEEALAKTLELTSEVAELKAERDVAAKSAAKEEQTRILGILKAAETLHLDLSVAVKRIKAGTSVEEAVSLFEDIAEAIQKSATVDVDGDSAITSTINKDVVEEETDSFMSSMEKAMEELDNQKEAISWGVK